MEYPIEARITKFIIDAEEILFPNVKKSKIDSTNLEIRLIESPEEIPTYMLEKEDAIIFCVKPDICEHLELYDVIIQQNYSTKVGILEVYISNGGKLKEKFDYCSSVPSFVFLLNQIRDILRNGFEN